MNILVLNVEDKKKNENEIISNEIICPECGENILLDINDFKINLFGCKNNHSKNDILLNNFENTQKIDITQITCNQCKVNNKVNAHNKQFYYCNTCEENLCVLCKSKHNITHFIINYDDKNYISQNIKIPL